MGNRSSTLKNFDLDDSKKFSHFPSKDVQEWSNEFRTRFPNGKMTLQDLEMMFRRFFPFGSPKKFVLRLFNTINISQSDYIDFHELLIAFSILMKGSNFEKLRWIFRFYDEDSDGVISKNEIVNIAQSMMDMVSNTLDAHIDIEKAIDELFECCDNKSGFFTFEDFKELAARKKEAFQMLTLFID
ncbi:neuronal calcium sensor 1 (NCS1) [Vairimorpha necatrix]|uniref:Neuronal calcium sensor 1 (NCS1) n=1 Tax=Vairimorpha necatrix TaxID=6039 RepID=A0AAX4JAQ0_9MICR